MEVVSAEKEVLVAVDRAPSVKQPVQEGVLEVTEKTENFSKEVVDMETGLLY